jgi:riboflavin kinase/FMN adenylyltransferase
MEVIRGIEHLKQGTSCAVTIGSFDGVHTGHLKIIEQLKRAAEAHGLCSTVVTFDPHPKMIVKPGADHDLKLLTTTEEKVELFRQTDIARLVIINFDKEFAGIQYEDFVRGILIERIGAATMVVGYDHAFGRGRQGNYEKLGQLSLKYKFRLEKVEAFEMDGLIVNSTNIRRLLAEGDVITAGRLLGRNYAFSGKVVKGRGLGAGLGYPTANLHITDPHKLIPSDGIYAVDVVYNDQKYKGMMDIGYSPTLSGSNDRAIEAHIFGFSKQVNDQRLTIQVKKRLRNEIRFDSRAALIAQLALDKQESLKV